MSDFAEKLVRQLKEIREKHGEAAYKDTCRDIARKFLGVPQGEAILKRFFPEIDVEEAKAGAVETPDTPPMPSFGSMPGGDEMMLQMLRAQIPNLTTQGQFNVFMACFDGLRATLNAYFGGQTVAGETARDALNKALDMAKQLTEMAQQLDEIPDGIKSEVAKEVNRPAKELHEYDEARGLITELEQIGDAKILQEWYDTNRARLDRIVSQKLRDEVFDAIRAKRTALGAN